MFTLQLRCAIYCHLADLAEEIAMLLLALVALGPEEDHLR